MTTNKRKEGISAVDEGTLSLSECRYLPRERTEKKRHDYRQALSHYYGSGLTLRDYI